MRFDPVAVLTACSMLVASTAWSQESTVPKRVYTNRLTPIENPPPLLADYPEFFEPITEQAHFEAPPLVVDERADLHVRAWRFSYNARGIIEMPNHLKAAETAVIMVHPWGIDDGQGWDTPEPAGVADFCTKEKNHLAARHTREIVKPFVNSLRGKAACVLYSLPGNMDPIRQKLYRSFTHKPTETDRREGARELTAKLAAFKYVGEPLPPTLKLSDDKPVIDYFQQFPGLDAGAKFNNAGFWQLPIPVTTDVDVHPDDVVIYDAEGYEPLKKFLRSIGVRHVLLTGYATDMCFCKTTAGYENLAKDFNVFLVGDASLATFPSNKSPRFAVNAAISFAALNQLVTQVSWVKLEGGAAMNLRCADEAKWPRKNNDPGEPGGVSPGILRPSAIMPSLLKNPGAYAARLACATPMVSPRGDPHALSRRDWLRTTAMAGLGGLAAAALSGRELRAAESDKALIAITLDLEMSANFPTRDVTHWNFEKGNLNDETKQYSVEAARRVKAAGGVLHFFAVGRVFEHASVDWIKEIVQAGHPVGNHTYDHVNVTATDPKDLQFRFQRVPWLLRGQSAAEVIRENILLTNKAMQSRLGIDPVGFRTPGGFPNGLRDHPAVRAMLRELGFDWISSLYPPHPNTEPLQEPSAAVLDGIIAAQVNAQPFIYPDGLIEVPMSPISDIGAFRTGRWQLDWFLRAIRQSVEWAIEHRAVFDFLAHPSCLYVVDPEFKSIELICDLVRKAGNRAAIVDLTTIARRAVVR